MFRQQISLKRVPSTSSLPTPKSKATRATPLYPQAYRAILTHSTCEPRRFSPPLPGSSARPTQSRIKRELAMMSCPPSPAWPLDKSRLVTRPRLRSSARFQPAQVVFRVSSPRYSAQVASLVPPGSVKSSRRCPGRSSHKLHRTTMRWRRGSVPRARGSSPWSHAAPTTLRCRVSSR